MKALFIEPKEVLYSGGSLYPDAISFLEGAKKGFAIIALTDEGQEVLGKELEGHNILGYFEMILSSGEYSTRKPDHRLINIALAVLRDRFGEQISKSSCALVGSRPYEDIKCGNDSGIKTVRVMRGIYANVEPEDDSEKPVAKVSDLKEALYVIAPEEARKAESAAKAVEEAGRPASKPGKKAKAKKKARKFSRRQIEEQFS